MARPDVSLPTEENHFKAYYASWVGGVFLLIGLSNLVFAIWLMLTSGQFSGLVVTGVVITAVGYLYLTRPYFVIAPNRLTLYNLLGSSTKRYTFADFSDIQIEDKKIYIDDQYSTDSSGTSRVQIGITQRMVKPADWKKIRQFVNL